MNAAFLTKHELLFKSHAGNVIKDSISESSRIYNNK